MATIAALARAGHEVTMLIPRCAGDPLLVPADLRDHFGVEGDFRLVQRDSRWSGEKAFSSAAWLLGAFRDPVVRTSDAMLCRLPVSLGLGAISPVPFAFDHYRPWPDELPFLRPLVRRLARSRNCLGFITHSHFTADAYRRAGVDPDSLLVAHNGVEQGRVEAGMAVADARARLGLVQGRRIILYAGRVNGRKGLDQLLAMAALRPDLLFVLVGSEGEGPIEQAARAHANLRIVGWQAPGALATWLSAADVLVIPPSRAPLVEHRNCVLPLKLFGYLAARRPILAPRAPDTAELLIDGDTAMLVAPDDPAAAAVALDRLLADSALGRRLSDNAFRLAQGLTWDDRARRIGQFLARRLDQRSERKGGLRPAGNATSRVTRARAIGGRSPDPARDAQDSLR